MASRLLLLSVLLICCGGIDFVCAQSSGNFVGTTILNETSKQTLRDFDSTTAPKKWFLCYSSSIVGASASAFHSACNQYSRTFTVISVETGLPAGGLFGGYTSLRWDSTPSGYLVDSTAYIFNIHTKKKWGTDGTHSIYAHPSYGPTFGHHAITTEQNGGNWYTDWDSGDAQGYPRPAYSLHPNDGTTTATRQFGNEVGTIEVYYTDDTPYYDVHCADGTANDPQVALAPPTLSPPTVSSNNYILKFEVDRRYERVRVEFGNNPANPCSMDTDDETESNGWTVEDGVADANCGELHTLTKTFQTMVAASGTGACEFTRSDPGNGFVEFSQDINIITNQTRTIEYQQGFRNQTYYEIKHTHYTIKVLVPTNVTVTSAAVNVTGNITVLQAITQLTVDADTDPMQVSFSMLTSSQAPYKLTYASFTGTDDLGNTIVRASDSPTCADTNFNTECVQTFEFSALDITTACPGKASLNDAMSITYNVGCKPSFTGNCQTPSPAQITVFFTLLSTEYCTKTDEVTLSASMDLYRDVDLTDTSAWSAAKQTNQFVVGSTTFGEVAVTVGENAATLATCKVRTITTTGYQNQVITVYTGGSGVSGAAVENGDTAQGGNVNFPNDNERARFSILWDNGVTVDLDPITDVAQNVVIQVVLDVSFTVASKSSSPVLQQWQHDHHSQHREVHIQGTQSGLHTATGVVGLTSPTATVPSSSSSSSTIAGMSTLTVVAVCAALVLLVVGASYKLGQRRQQGKDLVDQQESVEMNASQLRSSSAVHITTDTEESSTGAESVENSV